MDLAGELKKMGKIKVMVLTIVIGTLEAVCKSWKKSLKELEIRERIEIIQTIARSARILRKVLETCSLSDSSERLLANHIYPTPPLGQDMTQGQFLSGV